jgi:hypothetical protein
LPQVVRGLDERLVCQVHQFHLVAFGQRVVGAAQQLHCLRRQDVQVESGRGFGREDHEGDVEAPFAEVFRVFDAAGGVDGHGHTGVLGAEFRDEQGRLDGDVSGGLDQAESDLATQSATQLLQHVLGLLRGGECLPGLGEEQLTGFGQLHVVGRACEQLHPQLPFQVAHRGRDRRLHHAQPGGCAGEAGLVRDHDERPDLP